MIAYQKIADSVFANWLIVAALTYFSYILKNKDCAC